MEYALANPTNTNPAAISGGSILNLLFALGATLALIALLAWLLKRLPQRSFGAPALLKVVSSLSVGARERVVVVEAGETWLVLGVAPGRINTLKELPKPAADEPGAATDASARRFTGWLKHAMEQRNRG